MISAPIFEPETVSALDAIPPPTACTTSAEKSTVQKTMESKIGTCISNEAYRIEENVGPTGAWSEPTVLWAKVSYELAEDYEVRGHKKSRCNDSSRNPVVCGVRFPESAGSDGTH